MNNKKKEQYDGFKEHFLGYPCNTAYDYSEVFNSFKYNFNNIGDPSIPSLYKIHTKDEEKEVLKFFEELWLFNPDNVWGYITHSGTEGNLQGLYVGREIFPNGILYYSEDSHYSIAKVAKLLRIRTCLVKSQDNGEMDYKDFEDKLMSYPNEPAIICANLGTTMKGAIDNPRELYRILCKHRKQDQYYMHADGALMGFVLPFLESDIFYKKILHSISISGHKFLGVPFPCGIFMMEKRFLDMLNKEVEYIGSIDNTISGSRNGHSSLFLNYMIKKKGYDGFKQDILQCVDTSEYLLQKMQEMKIPSWRNNNSITVVFNRPHSSVVNKWQLASAGRISHAVIMPHVTKPKLNTFLRDFRL